MVYPNFTFSWIIKMVKELIESVNFYYHSLKDDIIQCCRLLEQWQLILWFLCSYLHHLSPSMVSAECHRDDCIIKQLSVIWTEKRTGHWETLFIHVNELTKIFGICVYLRHDIGKCRWLYIHGTCCTNNNSDLPLLLSFGVNTSDIYKHNAQSDDKCKNKSNVNRSYGRLLNADD